MVGSSAFETENDVGLTDWYSTSLEREERDSGYGRPAPATFQGVVVCTNREMREAAGLLATNRHQ